MVGNGWWIMFNDKNNLVGGDWNMAFYFSISYMERHPSHWLFFKMVETTKQNTFEYFFWMKMNIHVAVFNRCLKQPYIDLSCVHTPSGLKPYGCLKPYRWH